MKTITPTPTPTTFFLRAGDLRTVHRWCGGVKLPKIRICPQCYFVHLKSHKCPHCNPQPEQTK